MGYDGAELLRRDQGSLGIWCAGAEGIQAVGVCRGGVPTVSQTHLVVDQELGEHVGQDGQDLGEEVGEAGKDFGQDFGEGFGLEDEVVDQEFGKVLGKHFGGCGKVEYFDIADAERARRAPSWMAAKPSRVCSPIGRGLPRTRTSRGRNVARTSAEAAETSARSARVSASPARTPVAGSSAGCSASSFCAPPSFACRGELPGC